MIEIISVPPQAVATVWPDAMPLLARPIEMSKGCYLPEDVLGACQAGHMQLWIAADGEDLVAAYVTEITNYPRKKVIRAVFAGGKPHTMDRWLEPMTAAIEDMGKQFGCSSITAMGRKGWAKIVEGEEIAVVLWRDFPPMELH